MKGIALLPHQRLINYKHFTDVDLRVKYVVVRSLFCM